MAKDFDKKLVVDDLFSIPPGVVDARRSGEVDGESFYDFEDTATIGPILEDVDAVIPLPTSFTVVDQTIRFTSDGRSVVDVVLEFPDTTSVEAIDVKVTAL